MKRKMKRERVKNYLQLKTRDDEGFRRGQIVQRKMKQGDNESSKFSQSIYVKPDLQIQLKFEMMKNKMKKKTSSPVYSVAIMKSFFFFLLNNKSKLC